MASFDFDVVSAQPAPEALSALAVTPVHKPTGEPGRRAPQPAAPAKPVAAEAAARR